METTEHDVIFDVGLRPGTERAESPPWAPHPGRRMRLLVRRTEIIDAWRAAEPAFERFLTRS